MEPVLATGKSSCASQEAKKGYKWSNGRERVDGFFFIQDAAAKHPAVHVGSQAQGSEARARQAYYSKCMGIDSFLNRGSEAQKHKCDLSPSPLRINCPLQRDMLPLGPPCSKLLRCPAWAGFDWDSMRSWVSPDPHLSLDQFRSLLESSCFWITKETDGARPARPLSAFCEAVPPPLPVAENANSPWSGPIGFSRPRGSANGPVADHN